MPRHLNGITTFPSSYRSMLESCYTPFSSARVVTSSKQILLRRQLSTILDSLQQLPTQNLQILPQLSFKLQSRTNFSRCLVHSSLPLAMVPMPASPGQNPTVRITAFCIHRLCLGYRNQAVVPPPTDGPDFYSAGLVIGTIIVVICLLLMLLLVLLETIRLLTLAASPPDVRKAAASMARIYRRAIAACPPTYPTEPGTCAVCLEEYRTTTVGRKMPCQHFFHVSCIDRWILRSAAKRCQRDVVRCPVCKQPILQEHVEIPMENTPLISDRELQLSNELHLAENMV